MTARQYLGENVWAELIGGCYYLRRDGQTVTLAEVRHLPGVASQFDWFKRYVRILISMEPYGRA
jgi:hypothetical protein